MGETTRDSRRDDRDAKPAVPTTSSRRWVLRRVGAFGIGIAGVGAGTAGGTDSTNAAPDDSSAPARSPGPAATRRRQEGETAEPPLFDAHTHLIPEPRRGDDPLTADGLVEWMDANGVDRAVVHALDSPESFPVQVPSWWVLEAVRAYPDRLVPFCTVDPRTVVYGTDTVAARIDRYVERGARGFGELKAGLPIDDSRLEVLYERCAEHDLPVLFHTDEKAMVDDVGLPRLEDVLASYPEVDFLAHAHAWWAHISADVTRADRGRYPDRPVEPGGRVPELLERYDNIYGDLAGGSGWNALVRDEGYAQRFLEAHHEQLLFGTDYLTPGQTVPQFDLFERFDLGREARADLGYRNLERVLR